MEAYFSGKKELFDVLLQTREYIYIIEIKINDPVDATLQQIEEKAYARRFADDKRKIFKIGVRFSTENRCIDSWKVVIPGQTGYLSS